MLEHPDVAELKVVLLCTRDAHGVYRPFGFKELPDRSTIKVRLLTKLTTRLKVCLSDPGAVRLTSVLAGLGVPSSRQNMPVGGIVMRKALCAALGCVSFVGVAAGFAAAQQPAAVRPVDVARDKPDFTGVWTNYTAPGQAGGGGGVAPAPAPPCRSPKRPGRRSPRIARWSPPPARRPAATASARGCPARCSDREAIRWRSINGPSRS